MKRTTYRLYWLDGNTELVTGVGIAEAFSNAGYGGGAVGALDLYHEGDKLKYSWNTETKKWTAV